MPIQTYGAKSVDELRSSITETQSKRTELEKEIARYQDQIDVLSKSANTLSNTILSLDISRKKIEASVALTENKIKTTNLEVQRLGIQIGIKDDSIIENRKIIKKSFQSIYRKDSTSIIETFLLQESISSGSDEVYSLLKIQQGITDLVDNLKITKRGLEGNKKEIEAKNRELVTLRSEFKYQVRVLEENKKEKNKLLAETKNQEDSYKKLLAEKKAKHDEYARELFQYESELRIAINLNDIPSVGSKALSWPLDKVFVTQYYGNTEFVVANNPYGGRGHNGIDLRASVGTRVKTALGGVVKGTGNTDLAKGCYSYGNWVLVEHPNGLSTVYGHLSLVSVQVGQAVTTGDVIGYSGNTGYSFGPHLHFGVLATEGVRILKNPNSKYCSSVAVPSASLDAYQNPISFL